MRKQIENRTDISFLVHQFYTKIRADEEIGFYFTTMIKDWNFLSITTSQKHTPK